MSFVSALPDFCCLSFVPVLAATSCLSFVQVLMDACRMSFVTALLDACCVSFVPGLPDACCFNFVPVLLDVCCASFVPVLSPRNYLNIRVSPLPPWEFLIFDCPWQMLFVYNSNTLPHESVSIRDEVWNDLNAVVVPQSPARLVCPCFIAFSFFVFFKTTMRKPYKI